jgi:hypothetical protein
LGMDPLLIKRVGDWLSDAYMVYIEHHTPRRPGPPAPIPRSGLRHLRVDRDSLWCGQPRLGRLADRYGVPPLAADSCHMTQHGMTHRSMTQRSMTRHSMTQRSMTHRA